VKLLFDENLSRKLVARLAELYPDSVHVAEIGLLERSDCEIWEFAKAGLTPEYPLPVRGEPLVPQVTRSAIRGALNACEGDLDRGAIATLDWLDRLRSRVLSLR
jgi:hypothetical protein